MADIKKLKANTTTVTREPREITKKTGNLYRSLAIIGKRANQINSTLTKELREKLEEFGMATESEYLEEVQENAEQIEISKFYERIPKPTLLATKQFLDDDVYFRDPAAEASEQEKDKTE